MSTGVGIRRSAIDRIAQRFVADGYTVRREAVVDDLRVDLIVERDGEERVIEIIAPGRHISATARNRLEQWRAAAPNRFVDVQVLSDADVALPQADLSTLRSKLRSAESTIELLPEGSLLITWAVFEAVARALLEAEHVDPPAGTAVVRSLISHGLIDPERARVPSLAINVRNAVVHGHFVPIDTNALRALIALTDQLLAELETSTARSRATA